MAMMLLFLIPMTRRTRTHLGLVAAMLVFAVVAGCSGSAKPKTTTLTITGTSGNRLRNYTVNRQPSMIKPGSEPAAIQAAHSGISGCAAFLLGGF